MTTALRLNRLQVTAGIALLLALLLALQFSLAPAQGQKINPDTVERFLTYVPVNADGSATYDWSCTAGTTGHCQVQYLAAALSTSEAQTQCGADICLKRVEIRW